MVLLDGLGARLGVLMTARQRCHLRFMTSNEGGDLITASWLLCFVLFYFALPCVTTLFLGWS